MSIASVITGVRDALRQKAVEQTTSFRALALKLANGDRIKTESILAVLTAADKTADDLNEAVAAILERRGKHAKFKTLPGLLAERDSVAAAIAGHQADYEAATQRFRDAVIPLEARLAALDQQLIPRTRALKDELSASCDDPALLAKKAAAEEALAAARQAAVPSRDALARHVRLVAEDIVARRHRDLPPGKWEESDLDVAAVKKELLAERDGFERDVEKHDAVVRKAEAALAAVLDEMSAWTC
jgi:hypothetical protein